MKFLIICYCYPPDVGPRAYRWSAIAEDWARRGHEVHVISVKKLDWLAEERLNGVQVHRVAGIEPEGLRASVAAHDRSAASGEKRKTFNPGLMVKWFHDLTWKKLYWPDSNCFWYFPARRKAQALAQEIGFDAMVSVSTPYTGHLVGKAVKKNHPALRWMVDIGDPFCFSETPWNNERLYKRLNTASERRVFEQSDDISVTVESCADVYRRLFPENAEKIFVAPPLYSGSPRVGSNGQVAAGKTRLVFTGSLYSEIRNPGYLLALMAPALRKRSDLELHLFGRINDCAPFFEPYKDLLGGSLHVHGFVSRDHALRAIADADMLLNIGNDTIYQLPSKLVDCAATGKPIVNIIKNAEDSSVAFLENYPAGFNILDDGGPPDAEKRKSLERFIDDAPQKKPDIAAFMRPYLIESISEIYLEKLLVI